MNPRRSSWIKAHRQRSVFRPFTDLPRLRQEVKVGRCATPLAPHSSSKSRRALAGKRILMLLFVFNEF
jgi:hypothetical protein